MPNSTDTELLHATRYITALREGGSMPGLMEASDDGLYVVKFRGAGQGTLALAAELIAAELADRLEIRVPRLTMIDVDPAIGTAEPDPEIQELILASPGLNLGSDFLPGARTYSPAEPWQPTAQEAARIVWFDALITNVDRSARNPNLLIWHDRLWAIDHGAALFRQHSGLESAVADAAFPQIAEHVLMPVAGSISACDEQLAGMLTPVDVEAAVARVPEDWFTRSAPAAYVQYLSERLAASASFAAEAEAARVK